MSNAISLIEIPKPWNRLRAPANEDASPIDLTTQGNWANKPSGAIQIAMPMQENEMPYVSTDVAIAIAAGSAADKTLTWRLFALALTNGMIQQVAYGTATTGTQAVNIYPNGDSASNIYWCDTIVVTEYYWPKPVKATPNAGNNSVGMVSLDLLNWSWWHIQIEDADGVTGDQAGNVSVWYKGIC